jgi:hypothetical protein
MKLDPAKISNVYLTLPLNLCGASRMSITANDAKFMLVPGVGLLVESKGSDRQTTLIPWKTIDHMEIGGALLTQAPSPRVAAAAPEPAAPSEPAAPPPTAPRAPPPLTLHEMKARAALEERQQLAAERAAARLREQESKGGAK